MQAAIERAATLLAEAGAPVEDVVLPNEVIEAGPQFDVLTSWEGARVLEREARDHLDSFKPWNREKIEFARTLTEDRYLEANRILAAARASLATRFDAFDVLLTPPRIGEALVRIEGVRPSPFNAVWTQMYTPCVTLPLFEGPNGMPLGIQIVGAEHADDATLANAAWIDRTLRAALGTIPAGL